MGMILRCSRPASEWKEGLPIGNGRLAGMVMGAAPVERVVLNHEWLWRGHHRDRICDQRSARLPEIRRLFLAGKPLEAGQLANETLGGQGGVSGVKSRIQPYQPAGDLWIEYPAGVVSDYGRELDLATATVEVAHRAGDTRITRRLLCHAAHPVMVVRLEHEGEVGPVVLRLGRIEDPECEIQTTTATRRMMLEGRFPEGIRFAIEARVTTDGVTTPMGREAALRLTGASMATVVLTIAVDVNDGDPLPRCGEALEAVPGDWPALLESHLAAWQPLFGRVTVDLGPGHDDLPLEERLAHLRDGGSDESLLALYYDFGRYLLLSSAVGAELPPHLQGKWNEELLPPWDSDLHLDVNLQMNYWPAEPCNMPEALPPLLGLLQRLREPGRQAAQALYGCEGIYLPLTTDPWARCTPESLGWDVWTGAAAWLAQHLWWRYEYSLDTDFLREQAYPFLREVARFYETYLVPDAAGRLVAIPSQSPENTFVGGTSPVSLCVMATMDLELITEVLEHAIAANLLLGESAADRERWQGVLDKLPPLQTGRHGQLQEWLDDYEEAEPGHRHLSHLYALFPGDGITLERTPKLARAARTSLERRLAHGGGHTGWSRSWTACCWARLREGDLAHEHLRHLVGDFATDTLLDLHPPRIFQIDGNFGGVAAITEMLLQSHRGCLRLLPALPAVWPTGAVTGLAARGGFLVDLRWAQGCLRQATVQARHDGPCRLQFAGADQATVTGSNGRVSATLEGTDTLIWEARAGQTYALDLS